MLSLRLAWTAHAAGEAASGDWLAAIPAGHTTTDPEPPLRLCDANRLLPGGL
jgi:hypothetical protein